MIVYRLKSPYVDAENPMREAFTSNKFYTFITTNTLTGSLHILIFIQMISGGKTSVTNRSNWSAFWSINCTHCACASPEKMLHIFSRASIIAVCNTELSLENSFHASSIVIYLVCKINKKIPRVYVPFLSKT